MKTDMYNVSLDDTQQVAILDWQRAVSLPEFQEGYRAVGNLIQKRRLNRCLINTSSRGFVSAEAEEWLKSQLQNEANHFLLEEKQVAYVMSEENYQDMINDYSLLRAGHQEYQVNINYFTSIEEALHWLVHEASNH
ncbi:hypothetical protein [Rufibacter immobilis]|nr:hypothetical protein [Rufibacter immobilis]